MTKISATRIDMQDGRIDNAVLKNYAETLVGGATGTNTGTTYNVDLSTGNVFFLILNSATVSFVFSNLPPQGTYQSLTIILKQDSTGLRTVTWPANVTFGNGSTTPDRTANTSTLYHFFSVDGGARWFGAIAATKM